MKRSYLAVGLILAGVTATLAWPPADGRGLKHRGEGATAGYTLVAPLNSKFVYLLDLDGRPVHKWTCRTAPGNSSYLLPNGDLLRACRERDTGGFHGGGIGGRLQRYTWDGELVWDYDMVEENLCQHHDIEPLPNGNVLVIAWDRLTKEQAVEAGFAPDAVGDEIWLDQVLEIRPEGSTGGKVVWRWRAADHLVQERDRTAGNYASLADSPGRIQCDYGQGRRNAPSPAELERLRGLGYVGGEEEEDDVDEEEEDRGRRGRGRGERADWMHTNAIAYNAELDQIALSVHRFNEVWIIDHGISTEQAAGPQGDLLYRWGNPQAYTDASGRDQHLHGQHDVRFVKGGPSGWRLSVYNNGLGRRGGQYSSVDLIDLPPFRSGRYARDGERFGPEMPSHSYAGTADTRFYSQRISGAQVLPGGNLLVIPGEPGRIFEVTPEGDIVWDYLNPYGGDARSGPPGGPGRGGPRDRPSRRGGRDGDRGGPGRGPGNDNALFRADRYAPDYPAFRGRALRPMEGKTSSGAR